MRTSADDLVEHVRDSGPDVVAVPGDGPGPSVADAWRAVAGFGVEPCASIEFVARSASGDHICGITAEEYDYWVVSLAL
ncbi:hypothetical protein [Streptomyces sp. NPDC004050]